ncbi:MAG: hypothetical protein IBX64_02510 [Actinobacteria bacterium]|nr:hypothetical protein [Actinomycetota bacterium]
MDLKRILPIALIAVAILTLIVYAAYFGRTEAPVGDQTSTPSKYTPGQMTPQAPVASIPDKPVSSKEPATLVPEDTDLKQYCEKYYAAWKKDEWQTVYDMQPLAKKQQEDVNDFSERLKSYGLVGYTVGKPQINGHVGTVIVTLDMGQNGTMATHWTFVKNDEGRWTAQNSETRMSPQ